MQSPTLNSDQRRALVDLARRSIEARVLGTSPPSTHGAIDCPPASGVFVTVKLAGHLRGCLGTLDCLRASRARLFAVPQMRRATIRGSPRFQPANCLRSASKFRVLGPLEIIDPGVPGAVVIGEHGLVVERGQHRGLLLPQVATEWSWTPEEFLRHASHKAGLPWDGWEHGATVYRFSAEVFGG